MNLQIKPGEIYGLIGPNSAGKTTFFNVVTGLYTPDTGDFKLGGEPYQPTAVHEVAKAGIARTFQNIRLFGDIRALENVMVGRHVRAKAGSGTIPHMAAAALGEKLGTTFNHLPYQGSAPAIMGLLAGDVDATTVAYAELRQHVEAGKLRTLAVMSEKRVAGLDTVPTFKERGYDQQYSVWRGIALPKSAPPEVVQRLRETAHKIADTPAFRATVQKQNLTMAYADMPEFSAAIVRQSDNFKKLVPVLKLKE
ncbi:hypothetical protein CS8_045320 [Cupriavidus sp. 8B]